MHVLEAAYEIAQRVPQRVHLCEEYKVMIWLDCSSLIVKNRRHLACSLGDRRKCHLSTIPEAASGPATPQSYSISTPQQIYFQQKNYTVLVYI